MFATKFEYQTKYSFDKRENESRRVRERYPGRIPVICEVKDKKITIDKVKYLVPNSITIGQFLFQIRKRINILPDAALYLFTEKNTLPPISAILSQLYRDYANCDGFLYFHVGLESTFGGI